MPKRPFGTTERNFSRVESEVGHLAWKMLDGETIASYEAFLYYLSLPPGDNTQIKVSEHLAIPYQTIMKWSRDYAWQERRALYAANQFQIAEEEKRKVLKEKAHEYAGQLAKVKDRSLSLALAMQEKAQGLLDRVNENTDFKISDIPRLVDSAVKNARLAAELPTEIIRTDIVNVDVESLETPEQLQAYIEQLEAEEKQFKFVN